MMKLFVPLLLFVKLPSSHSQALGTEENPFPEDDEGSPLPEDDEGSPLQHYEDQGADITAELLHTLHDHLDGNKDGKVSIIEITLFHHKAKKVMASQEIEEAFHEIESTKDGHLSLEEHMEETDQENKDLEEPEKEKRKAFEKAKFAASDVNGDGKLNKSELVYLMHPDTRAEVLDVHVDDAMRNNFDTNNDGKISAKEWGEDDNAQFQEVDTNKDGYVDIPELKHLESGDLHLNSAMTKLLDESDKDGDKHFSKEELAQTADKLEDHPAHQYLNDWIFHYIADRKGGKDEM